MVTGWGSAHADRRDDQYDDSIRRDVGDGSATSAPHTAAGSATMTVGDREERLEWDAFVRSHIADVWSHATAEGLSQADAMDVCELVWRNAAQRLPVLVTSADPRTDLLADVTREARRLLRLRSADSANFAGHDAPRQRTIRLDGNESAAGLAAHAAARPTRNSHGR